MKIDEEFLRRAIEIAFDARRHGNHPFGAHLALDGKVALTAENTVNSERNPTCHAETNLVQKAIATLDEQQRARATLYTSCEPCAMCAGTIYWAGIQKIVYALSSEQLAKSAGETGLAACREIFIGSEMEVAGPFLFEEAIKPHEGYWK
jgi:tRNA(Arg) A34 adenosine deaminase TadA